MTDRTSPPVGTLLDVIVLCFAKSELKELVGTDALRVVLESRQREIFPDVDVMTLQPVWELLESQQGFDRKMAFGPVCRLKSWERRLGVRVEMPSTMSVLDEATREKLALDCTASDADLAKVLRSATANTPVPLERALTTGTMKKLEPNTTPRKLTPLPSAGLSTKAKLAIGAAAIGLAAAGVSAYLTFRSKPGAAAITPSSELSDQIPFSEIRIKGALIVAKVGDPKWLDKPEAERRVELEATIPKLQAKQATKLIVLDATGGPVANVLVDGKPPVAFAKR